VVYTVDQFLSDSVFQPVSDSIQTVETDLTNGGATLQQDGDGMDTQVQGLIDAVRELGGDSWYAGLAQSASTLEQDESTTRSDLADTLRYMDPCNSGDLTSCNELHTSAVALNMSLERTATDVSNLRSLNSQTQATNGAYIACMNAGGQFQSCMTEAIKQTT